MRSGIAFPFLVLPDDAIRPESWMIGDPGHPLHAAGDILEHWDYARDLEVSTTVSIDMDIAAKALQLPRASLQLKLVLLVGTGVGNLPRRQDRLVDTILNADSSEAHISAIISGRTLSGRIRLTLQVLLEAPTVGGTQLSPVTRGSKLWRSHKEILIEDGGDSRFPMETASFAQIFKGMPQERAPWYLHWRPAVLHADFSGSVRLYVNSDQKGLAERFAAGDPFVLQAMLADVISQMSSSVLDHDDGVELLGECEEGSVGGQILHWLDLAFPGQDFSSIGVMKNQFPGRFRAAILAAADMASFE